VFSVSDGKSADLDEPIFTIGTGIQDEYRAIDTSVTIDFGGS
jgi:hypothetical protein